MANVELQLLSNIIDRGQFQEVRHRGVTSQLFQGEEARELFAWLHAEVLKPGTKTEPGGVVPSYERVRRTFPEFDFCPSRDTLAALIDEVVDNNVSAGIREITAEMDDLLDSGESPDLVLQGLLPALRDLSVSSSRSSQTLISSAAADLRAEYEAMEQSGGITGIPWPWGPMNRSTGGMQDQEWLVFYARPKMMKCVVAGQKIMTRSGKLVPIEELPEECEVPSYTEATGKLRWAKAKRVYSGEKDCVRVVTESGYTVETGDKHYFMVPEGSFEGSFERICDLEVGDWVATTRNTPAWDGTGVSTELAWILGTLVGDGNYARNGVQFSNHDQDVVDMLSHRVGRFECEMREAHRPGEYRITAPGRPDNPLLTYLRKAGMHGKKAEDKDVPEGILTAGREAICAFLAGLLDTDGNVWAKKPYTVSWCTASKVLADGVKHLLSRLGVVGSPYWSENAGKGQWIVTVTGLDQHQKLCAQLAGYVECAHKREAFFQLTEERFTKRNVDGVPYSEGLMQLILREKEGKEWPKMGQSYLDRSKLFRRSGKISRALLMKMANKWDSEPLRIVAEQDVLWDRIREITPVGRHDCYDICIQDGQDPNFVVEGFAVHNTWLALHCCVHAYSMHNRRVLCYSKEMSKKQMIRRVASLITGIDYEKLKTAGLNDDEREDFFELMESLEDWEKDSQEDGQRAAMSFISDREMGGKKGATVDTLVAEAEKFKADLLLIDGFYLMRDGRTGLRDRGWKTISNISSDIKDAAQYLDIPIIGTTQANRSAGKTKGDDTDEVAFADAIGQDCDMLARIFKAKNHSTGKPKLMLTFPGVRDSVLNPFVVNAWPGCDFTLLQNSVNVDSFLKESKDYEEESDVKAKAKAEVKKRKGSFGKTGKRRKRRKTSILRP